MKNKLSWPIKLACEANANKMSTAFKDNLGSLKCTQGHTEDIEAIPEERLKLDSELPVFLRQLRLASKVLSLSV